jgi:carbonic anhydrase
MSVIDELLQANESYAQTFNLGHLPNPPARNLVVVACMDARMDILQMLGLKPGDAHVIRNAGGIVTDDVLRSLIISHYLLFTREIMIINHTECGMVSFKDEELRARLRTVSGTDSIAPSHFHAFTDLEENVHHQMQKVKSHPWLPSHIPVRGFIYDVKTGRLREVAG